MNNKDNIENLIERFFEGMTSNLEEKQLYDFFAQEEIPDELKKYKPVFEYFHSGIVEETTEQEKVQNIVQKKSVHHYKKIIYAIGGIAASILILFSVYSLLTHKQENFNPYEGSYIVRNGVRITDIDIIKPELEKTYREAIQQQKKVKKTIEKTVYESRGHYDAQQEIKAQYNDLLDQAADDEYTRKKIEQIFESI